VASLLAMWIYCGDFQQRCHIAVELWAVRANHLGKPVV
jgi:hypothetical protein